MPGAFSDWSPKDFALLGTSLAATYADNRTTKDLIGRGGQETNPVYGTPHPTGEALDRGGLLAAGAAAAVAHKIPPKYRSAFLGGWTGLEGGLAYQNAHTAGDSPRRSFGEALAIPALMGAAGAAAGYLLPSGSGDTTVGPGMVQGVPTVSYTKKFSAGGPVLKVHKYAAPVFRIHGFKMPAARRRSRAVLKLLRTR